MKIYLVGYMYCGKSTYGRRLAAERGMDFLDLDRAFEERYHYTVPRFFATFGEEAFRKLESRLLRSDNMDFILAHGTAVYLRMDVDQLVARALGSRNPRPLMQGIGPDQLRSRIEAQLKEREVFYRKANIVLDGENPSLGS